MIGFRPSNSGSNVNIEDIKDDILAVIPKVDECQGCAISDRMINISFTEAGYVYDSTNRAHRWEHRLVPSHDMWIEVFADGVAAVGCQISIKIYSGSTKDAPGERIVEHMVANAANNNSNKFLSCSALIPANRFCLVQMINPSTKTMLNLLYFRAIYTKASDSKIKKEENNDNIS